MKAVTRRKILLFFFGLVAVSILTMVGTVAFMGSHVQSFVRNIAITDIVFVALFVIWAKVNKGYEDSYKSELSHEHERPEK